MPRRKKYYKKRRYRRKRRNFKKSNNNSIALLKNPSPLPTKFRVAFRYANIGIDLNPGAGGLLANHVWAGNDLRDPNVTGAGHQPSGFDQLMTMYDHFTVIGARLHCTFVNEDTANAQMCGVSIRDTATVETDPRVIIESGACKYAVIGPEGSSRDTKTISYNLNPSKFLGRSKPLSDPDLKGSTSASPAEMCYFHTWAGPTSAVDAGIVNVNILLEYTAILTEPVQVGLS